MMDSKEWSDNVYAEKSLQDVYKKSKEIPRNRFNVVCIKISISLALFYNVVNAYTGVDNKTVLEAISRISESMITATTAILGFLIAGFSIFVSSTPNKTLMMLLNTRYESTSISYFKTIMFNFLNVFTVYLVCMMISLLVNVVCPLGWIPIIDFNVNIRIITIFNCFILSFLMILTIYSTLRLKSFIWTMYQGLIVNMMLENESNKLQ